MILAFTGLRACLTLQCYVDMFISTEINLLEDPIQQILIEHQWGTERGSDLPKVTPLVCGLGKFKYLSVRLQRPCCFHYPGKSTNVYSISMTNRRGGLLRREIGCVGGIRKENTQQ